MTPDVSMRMLEQRAALGNTPRAIALENNEVMFRSCGSCNGELLHAYFVTKDLNEALPVNQAHWMLNHQAFDFAILAYGLMNRGES